MTQATEPHAALQRRCPFCHADPGGAMPHSNQGRSRARARTGLAALPAHRANTAEQGTAACERIVLCLWGAAHR